MPEEKKKNLTEVTPEGVSHKANEDKTDEDKKVQDLTEVKPPEGKTRILG